MAELDISELLCFSTEEVTVEKYIKDILQTEIGEVIRERHYYLAFFLIASGIEFLGKCVSNSCNWHQTNTSAYNFKKIITEYSPFKDEADRYIPHAQRMFDGLRCGLVHAMRPDCDIVLCNGESNLNGKEKDGKLYLFLESFYGDFKLACDNVLSKTWPINGHSKDETFFVVRKYNYNTISATGVT